MTQYETLLSVAATLNEWFTPAELIVAAFQKEPKIFGLRSYPQYPDSNRVGCALCGRKGLVGRGWLERDEEGRLRVTEKGRRVLRPEAPVVQCAKPVERNGQAQPNGDGVVIGVTSEEVAEFQKGNVTKAVQAIMRRARVCRQTAERMLWEGVGA